MPSNYLQYNPQLQLDVCNHSVAHLKQGNVSGWPYAEGSTIQRSIYKPNLVKEIQALICRDPTRRSICTCHDSGAVLAYINL